MCYKEKLPYSNYHRSGFRKSFYIFGLTVWDENLDTMICPKCKNVRKAIKHGNIAICERCGLNMQVFGNELTIWM